MKGKLYTPWASAPSIETFLLVVGSRAEGGMASKLGNETRLMTMKGGTVLDSVKMLAFMLGGCNIGLQGVLMEF